MSTQKTDDTPSVTDQLDRIRDLGRELAAAQDRLDTVSAVLQDFHEDDYHLDEDHQMPHLEAIDLQNALEDTLRGLRAVNRIIDLHKVTLSTTDDCSKRAHLSAVPPTS